uniref:NADH:ubiquinone reductase (non-electrogenic) n=1 Tax=Lactuca sativa TaxID=4236 RepID=A0A9R1VQZ9_LACSA|nr:hypothetical protein LSAT_V11C400204860 [Lactuca sativa]
MDEAKEKEGLSMGKKLKHKKEAINMLRKKGHYVNQVHAIFKSDELPEAGNKKKKLLRLETAWGRTSFLKKLKNSSYDVQLVLPRNYFRFTPLLPILTINTVEARCVEEPVHIMTKNDP